MGVEVRRLLLGLVFQGIFCGKWHRIKTQAREKSGKPAKRQNRRIKRIPTTRLRMSRKSPRDPRVAAVPQVAVAAEAAVQVPGLPAVLRARDRLRVRPAAPIPTLILPDRALLRKITRKKRIRLRTSPKSRKMPKPVTTKAKATKETKKSGTKRTGDQDPHHPADAVANVHPLPNR